MATLKLVVVPAKILKNGKHKIRVAVSHKEDTRYIVQNFTIDSLNQFKEGQVVNHPEASIMNKKLRLKLNQYQDALDAIDPDVYTASQLRDFIDKNTKIQTLTISQAANEHIKRQKKESTRESYERTIGYFVEQMGDLPLEMITPSIVEDFMLKLEEKGLNTTTQGIHIRQLKSFILPQINMGNVTYKVNPFYNVSMPESQERELDITVEEFKLIRDSTFKEKPLRVARDLFCLSYYLGGINLIDLMDINFKNTDVIDYVREKSSNMKRGE